MKATRLIPVLILIIFGGASALSGQKTLKKAEKQFSLKAYDLAVANFTRALEEDPECTHCIFMVAESYRMMNKNIDATLWFRKLDGKANIPEKYKLSYGLTMKRMGQYDKAQNLFFEYAVIDPVLSDHFAQSCEYAKTAFSNVNNYDISLLRTCSSQSDFAPTFWKDKLIYSSFRTDLRREHAQLNKSYIHNPSSQLFVSGKGFDVLRDDFKFLRSDLEEDFEISCASVSGNNQHISYVKANFVDGFKQIVSEEMDISLYTATILPDGRIENEKAFKHNEIGYATAFPSLNYDGKILYFASNRPGGLGGYDLYVSYYKNGEWTYPENLGDKINTPGNEVTPFFDGSRLFFASDYHYGFGGFDLFESKVEQGAWIYPSNMGNGINSPEDDLYLIADADSDLFYYTSNRLGGRGKHDIYTAAPIIEHDMAVIDFNIREDAMVPKAVSLEDLYTSDETANDLVVNVNQSEPIIERKATQDTEEQNDPINEILDSSEDIVNLEETEYNPDTPPLAVDLNLLEADHAIKSSMSTKDNTQTISMSGAKRVAFGEVIRSSSNVYFIQLAAIFANKANVDAFTNLRTYGSVYKMYENSAIKIRLGYYLDEFEAKEILKKVKNAGYMDAFITKRPLNTSNMELAISSDNNSTTDYTTSGNSQYKVRLASYEDPIYFDVNRVKDIGVIEQWSKRNWTIFILSGYSSLEEAERAKIKALNRGFSDAEIVVDNNGILEKLIRN